MGYMRDKKGRRLDTFTVQDADRPATTPSNTMVLFGDSITANCTVYTPGSATPGSGSYISAYSGRSWFHLLNQMLGQRITVLNNAGISGNTTAQMLARIQADVLAYKPSWAWVMAGVNDVQNDVPLATIQANIDTIVKTLRAAGIRVILAVPLTSGLSGPQLAQTAWAPNTAYVNQNAYLQGGVQYRVNTGYTSGSTFGATDTANATAVPNRRDTMLRLQRWVAAYARDTPGVVPIEWHKVMTNAADGSGVLTPPVTSDGTHPQLYGASLMAAFAAPTIAARIPAVDHMPVAAVDPDQKLPNPMMTGTSGSNAGTGGTGQVANSTQMEWSGTAGVYVASKVARTDGYGGEWQKLQVTTGGQLDQRLLSVSLASLGFAVGDIVKLRVEVQPGGDWVGTPGVYAQLTALTSGFGILGHWRSVDVENNLSQGVGLSTPAGTQILETAPMTIPVNTGLLNAYLYFHCGADGSKTAATGSLLIGRCSLFRADAA